MNEIFKISEYEDEIVLINMNVAIDEQDGSVLFYHSEDYPDGTGMASSFTLQKHQAEAMAKAILGV